MDDDLERRVTRRTVLRLAAAGATGLALGVRSARAAATDAAAVEAAASRFLASLSDAHRDRATFRFDGSERTRWHWTVPSSVPRDGLPLGTMSPGQRRLALSLLRASCSAGGYRRALDIMALQGVLRRMNTGISDPFDPDSSTSPCSAFPELAPGAGGSKATISRGTSPSYGTRSSRSRSSSALGRSRGQRTIDRLRRATARCLARKTPLGRSCCRSTARSGGGSCSRPSR